MKVMVIALFMLANVAYAAPICKPENQWKCDSFNSYDRNANEMIEGQEISAIYIHFFKKKFEEIIKQKYPGFSKQLVSQLGKSLFRYYLKYDEYPKENEFQSIWKFIKYVLKKSRLSVQMDFSDFVLKVEEFGITEENY